MRIFISRRSYERKMKFLLDLFSKRPLAKQKAIRILFYFFYFFSFFPILFSSCKSCESCTMKNLSIATYCFRAFYLSLNLTEKSVLWKETKLFYWIILFFIQKLKQKIVYIIYFLLAKLYFNDFWRTQKKWIFETAIMKQKPQMKNITKRM